MSPAPTVRPAGGAAVQDILLVGGIISLATVAMLTLVVLHRTRGVAPLRLGGHLTRRVLGVPGWAALPALATIGAAVVTFGAAIWDIGVHIDLGRDSGPFGTAAHYPLLGGLVLVYLVGVLAVGMTPPEAGRASRVGVPIPGLGNVAVGALLILAGGGFAMLGFPLDDLWHRAFGQDVTLWGPTHTMFFGGLIAAASGAVVLFVEGARANGREPFLRASVLRGPVTGVLAGVFLFVATHATDEFNWGVPQYRQVWQPLVLLFFGALALTVARALGGRAGLVAALASYLPLQLAEVVLIGLLGTTQPASVLFLAEAGVVEAAALALGTGRGLRFGALAGLGIGTVGFAAEYAWSHVAMPLPWRPALLPEALPTAVLASVAGGVLGALMAQALTGTLAAGRRPLRVALGAAAVVLALALNAGIARTPAGQTATLALTGARAGAVDGEATRVADLAVRTSDPGLTRNANWAYVLGWQGGGRFRADLERGADGVLRATGVPIGGDWKAVVRFHQGRTQVSAPVRMPADPGAGFAGYPARPEVTRSLVRDTKLMQVERKDGGWAWAWMPAMLLVMSLNLALMALVAWGCTRAGRAVRAGDRAPRAPWPGRGARRSREPAGRPRVAARA